MNSLEIFSGAGGLAKGLALEGFDHSAFIEFDKHACESLYENYDKEKVFYGDVRNYDFDILNDIDLVAGGPPCQPFSLGGKHKANKDNRDMFPYAIKAIEQLSPKAFIFENVKGLLRASFRDYFEYITLRLSYPGYPAVNDNWREHLVSLRNLDSRTYKGKQYKVKYMLLNAADFGVPQCRERVVIVGVRSDIKGDFHFPKPTHSEDKLIWDKFITGEYWDRHKITNKLREKPRGYILNKINRVNSSYGLWKPELLPWNTIRDALSDVPDPRKKHNIPDHIYRDGAKCYAGHTGSDIDWPSKTVKAGGHGVPGGENMMRYLDGSVRYFTVYEAKIIQTFPRDYIIKGSWGEALRQIGNAVPVLLARKIGDELFKVLSEKEKGNRVKSYASKAISKQNKIYELAAC